MSPYRQEPAHGPQPLDQDGYLTYVTAASGRNRATLHEFVHSRTGDHESSSEAMDRLLEDPEHLMLVVDDGDARKEYRDSPYRSGYPVERSLMLPMAKAGGFLLHRELPAALGADGSYALSTGFAG